ncbi:MAG: toxic anion resistance protein [Bacilli bacterium]
MNEQEENVGLLDQASNISDQERQMQLIADRKNELRKSPEVLALAKSININDQVAILEFGKEPADAISAFTGSLLGSVKASKMEDTSKMMSNLNKIMQKFDSQDFADQGSGLLSKLFNNAKKSYEKLMSKYQTMDHEIDIVYTEIKKYEMEMKKGTNDLENLYHKNYQFYLELCKYAMACEVLASEAKERLPLLNEKVLAGDENASFELDSLNNIISLLEQRNYDLNMAQVVSFQAAPQIRMLQSSNNMLVAKINSAFVTTIPIFKLGLIQAVQAKRQELVADSLSALDKTTNELLKNSVNRTVENSKKAATLAGQSSVSIDTLKETWQTIVTGMQETQNIQAENKIKREQGLLELEKIQAQYQANTKNIKG